MKIRFLISKMTMPVRRSERLQARRVSPYFKNDKKVVKRRRVAKVEVKIEEEIKTEIKQENEEIKVKIEEDSQIQPAIKEEAVTNEEFKQEIKREIKREISNGIENSLVPDNFFPIYKAVEEARASTPAPVDTVGCAVLPITLAKQFNYTLELKQQRFQTMVSLMLSAQTKDEVNYQAMSNLTSYLINDKKMPLGITLESILEIDEAKLDELIFKVGFHKRKSSFIKRTCVILRDTFNSEVPKTIEEITSLPGIGPKMGYLLLQTAWGITDGIGVDVHVHRLSNQWNWVKSKNPEETRKQLESWLPFDLWNNFNPSLVGFGQTICGARNQKCHLCPLGIKEEYIGLCKKRKKINNK